MRVKIQHYSLEPEQGWGRWSHNPDLSNLIFEIGIKNANSDKWNYINPMIGMGIFEDKLGQYLCLETKDIGDRNHIISMHYGIIETDTSDFLNFIEMLKGDYDLVASLMVDNDKIGELSAR